VSVGLGPNRQMPKGNCTKMLSWEIIYGLGMQTRIPKVCAVVFPNHNIGLMTRQVSIRWAVSIRHRALSVTMPVSLLAMILNITRIASDGRDSRKTNTMDR